MQEILARVCDNFGELYGTGNVASYTRKTCLSAEVYGCQLKVPELKAKEQEMRLPP